jgi:WD40 repeat protein
MHGEDKILITSNDSRIRLYDLRDLSLVCKYKGYTNLSSQIRASFSPDGRYICSGSENQCVFLWSSLHTPQALTARKDRNNYYEAIRAHGAVVTCSLFAPDPRLVLEAVERGRVAAGKALSPGSREGYVVVSGDFDGDIKIFINQTGLLDPR